MATSSRRDDVLSALTSCHMSVFTVWLGLKLVTIKGWSVDLAKKWNELIRGRQPRVQSSCARCRFVT